MILVTFALPAESRRFLRLLLKKRKSGGGALPVIEGNLGSRRIRVLHLGMGKESAMRQMDRWGDGVTGVICAGFAGALLHSLALGEVILTGNHLPGLIGSSTRISTLRRIKLITVNAAVESPAAKEKLRVNSGCDAVDMETAPVTAWCAERKIPIAGLRVISDTASQSLPVPIDEWFNRDSQRPNVTGLIRFLVRNPGKIQEFARFVSGLRICSQRLAIALPDVVDIFPGGPPGPGVTTNCGERIYRHPE